MVVTSLSSMIKPGILCLDCDRNRRTEPRHETGCWRSRRMYSVSAPPGEALYGLVYPKLIKLPRHAPVPTELMELLLEAAANDSVHAMFAIGFFLMDGRHGIRPNPEQAVKWLDLSAECGYRCAQYWRGSGNFGRIAYKEAVKNLFDAASRGCGRAILALCRDHADLLSEQERIRLLGCLANAGAAPVASYLAHSYLHGQNCPKSFDLAVFWAKRASELGHRGCAYWLRRNAPKTLRLEN